MNEPFDKDELLEELEHDVEFLVETYEMFTDDVGDLIRRLGESLTDGDSAAVAATAHTIKSMVGNFCAAPAHQAALELEMLGKSGKLSDAPAKTERLHIEVNRLKAALSKLIEELR